jgi:diketogulonate reductase-like aldo/keto reductase
MARLADAQRRVTGAAASPGTGVAVLMRSLVASIQTLPLRPVTRGAVVRTAPALAAIRTPIAIGGNEPPVARTSLRVHVIVDVPVQVQHRRRPSSQPGRDRLRDRAERRAGAAGRRAAARPSGRTSRPKLDGMTEHTRVLADGNEIPLLGLGVWQVPDGPVCEEAVRTALELGYRHIDTAQAYGNERSVGRALRDSGIPREEVFVTTKFYPARADAEAEAQRSLERLGVEYVDLYIIHWPQGGATWAWDGMQRAHERGFARSIGVSNFSAGELDELLAVAEIRPVINQVQFNPFAYRRRLLEACEERQIALEAYSPLGTGRHLDDPRVGRIAERHGRTPAQVLIRWCVQRELIVLPKSTHRERIAANAQVFDFSLSDEEMATLDALDATGGTAEALERKWW